MLSNKFNYLQYNLMIKVKKSVGDVALNFDLLINGPCTYRQRKCLRITFIYKATVLICGAGTIYRNIDIICRQYLY